MCAKWMGHFNVGFFNIGYFNLVMLVILMPMSAVTKADLIGTMEKALMPGELVRGHAEFEDDCELCHKFFRQAKQNDMCLDCHDHENVAKDIKDGTGYHGRIAGVKEKECKTCHREHQGRDADIIFLDEQTFDHNQTDFKLRASHLEAQCSACHKEDKKDKKSSMGKKYKKGWKYHEAKHKCIDCHKDEEPHKGKLGKVCNSCHIESNWTDFQFDHSRTEFKLEGKHKGVECRDCHPQEKYLATPTTCFGCHERDDKHEGRYGGDCKKCHTPLGWASLIFNHDKDTKYKLIGRHKQVTCDQCHPAKVNAYKVKTKDDCYSCHKFSDEHKGLYGKKCKDCHNTKGWAKNKFDHDKTDFPLKGKHKKTACNDCHPGELYDQKLSTKCYECHVQHDVHNGQLGKKCNDCHVESGWIKDVEFDHDITLFPLLGSHATLACEDCHSSTNFKNEKPKCVSCHRNDDVHKQRLGVRCAACHNAVDWKAWAFDHGKKTEFELKGEHEDKDCLLCHREVVEEVNKKEDEEFNMPGTCHGCHAADDIHDGGFGRSCDRCHNEKAFDEIDMSLWHQDFRVLEARDGNSYGDIDYEGTARV